jgi:hypothetical protein
MRLTYYPSGSNPAFIKRSLKRSLSQTSGSSLRSVASGAPKLPPLKLRPSFNPEGSLLSSPQHSPPSAQSCQSYTTPQSVTSPRSHKFSFLEHPQKYSAIYEDASSERTGSFVTAHSGATESGPFIITKYDIPSSADLVIHTSEGIATIHGGLEGNRIPPDKDLLDACLNVEKDSSSKRNAYSVASTTTKNDSDTGENSLAKDMNKEGDGDGESFVMRRWERGIMTFRNVPDEFTQAKHEGGTNYTRQACLLFWLGFVAPWCWLIGGWMLPVKVGTEDSEKQTKSDKTILKREGIGQLVGAEEKAGYMERLKKLASPHDHPSSRFTAPSSIMSTHGLLTLQPKKLKDKARSNVWVSRCRVAAIAGGVCFALALLITLPLVT